MSIGSFEDSAVAEHEISVEGGTSVIGMGVYPWRTADRHKIVLGSTLTFMHI